MNNPTFILKNYIQPKLLNVEGGISNASLFKKNNNIFLLGRKAIYSFINIKNTISYWPMDIRHISLQNIYCDNGNTWSFMKTISCPTPEEIQKYTTSGNEDFRVINHNNTIYCSFVNAKVFFDTPTSQKCIYTMNTSELNDDFDLINIKELKTNNDIEKNWQPIVDNPNIFIYQYNPFTLIDINTMKFINLNNLFDIQLSGSTQLIKYKENYLCVCHMRTIDKDGTRNYFHYFVLFDKNLNLLKISKPFKFFGANIEFCVYIGIIDNKIILINSINDQISYKFELDDNLIDDIFNEKLDNSTIEDNLYDNIFDDAITNKNWFFAITLATFSKNINVIHKAEYLLNTADLYLTENSKKYLKNIFMQKILN